MLAWGAIIVIGTFGCVNVMALGHFIIQKGALFVVPSLGRAQNVLAWGAIIVIGALG